MVRNINASFVPVALKAGLVNNPPGGDEGRLYAEISRSKPAPQGICVVNSAGKVLSWVLMFDDDHAVADFLDYALARYAAYPAAKNTVAAERFMKFPSQKLEDVEDSGKTLPVVDRHGPGTTCPAQPPLRPGTIMARVFGRALDSNGRPMADTRRQEHYVEDRFEVPAGMQEALVKSVSDSGAKRVRVADDLARLLVSHAYLGQLDVNPVESPAGRGALRECEFWAQPAASSGDDPPTIRIEGKSTAAGPSLESERVGQNVDGRVWEHEVKLAWEGLIETRERRISRLLLTARGFEKLKWRRTFRDVDESDVAHLPAGRPIDLACAVRYGIIGEPVPVEQTEPDAPEQVVAATANIPEEVRRQVIEMLGPPFVVFRDNVAKELNLTDEQSQRLAQHLQATVGDTLQTFQKIGGLPPEEREKALHAHRQRAHEALALFLKDMLGAAQQSRLRELELQQEGPFALGRPDIATELNITDDQRRQFMAHLQEMQREIESLIKAAQAKGNADDIRPRAMKVRGQYADKIEALLTATQKEKWKALLGEPFDPDRLP